MLGRIKESLDVETSLFHCDSVMNYLNSIMQHCKMCFRIHYGWTAECVSARTWQFKKEPCFRFANVLMKFLKFLSARSNPMP
jgi:hypothetical protein